MKPIKLFNHRWGYGKVEWLLIGMIALGILSAVNVLWHRVQFERGNRTVELVMAYDDVQKLAALEGVSPARLLATLNQKSNITGIAVSEENVESMVANGKMSVVSSTELKNFQRLGLNGGGALGLIASANGAAFSELKMDDALTTARVRESLRHELGKDRVIEISATSLVVLDDSDDLKRMGLGFSPEVCSEIQAQGLQVVPRLQNSERLTDDLIRFKLARVSEIGGATTIIFDGDTIMGYPHHISKVAKRIQNSVFNVGMVEFVDQKGIVNLAARIPDRILRVHSIPVAEMADQSLSKIVKRYIRAANERGVVVLFVHPVLEHPSTMGHMADTLKLLDQLNVRLGHDQFSIASVKQTAATDYRAVSKLEILLITLGIGAGTVLLIRRLVRMTTRHWIGVLGGGALVLLCLVMSRFSISLIQWIGVLGAVVFPCLAIITGFPQQPTDHVSIFRRYAMAVQFVLSAAGISLIGALYVAALFSSPRFVLGIQIFSGVKLAFVLPLIIVGVYFYLRPHRLAAIYYVFKRLFLSPAKSGALLAAAFCVLFVFILLLRSGNYISFSIPGAESGMRDWLETVLRVRPRTKEFLIGYPMLIFAFMQVDRRISRQWIWLFLCIGLVGLISMVNSFCHFHTPLKITVYRSVVGLVLGIGLGMIYFWVFELIINRKRVKGTGEA